MQRLDTLFQLELSIWLLILGALLVGLLLARLTIYLVTALGRFSSGVIVTTIKQEMTKGLYFFFPILLFSIGSIYYESRHPGTEWVLQFSKVAMVTVSTWLLIRMVIIIEKIILLKLEIDPTLSISDRKIYTRIKFVTRLIIVAVSMIAFATLLLSFEQGRKFGVGLLTSAGIVSVIIGFAAQKTLGNLMASMQIAFSQPIKIGDTVVVENEVGQIEEINLTYVVTSLWDRRRLILPITYFVETPFQNWTRNDHSLIAVVLLYLDYRTPMDLLREQFNELVHGHPKWDGEVCELHITDTQQQQMIVRATMSVANPKDSFELRSFVREGLIAWLRDNHPESLPGTRLIND